MRWISDGIDPGEVVAVLTTLTLLAGGLRWLWVKVIRRLLWLIDDMQGEPERPGQSRRPGWGERIASMEAQMSTVRREVTHNSGSSLKDAVGRTELSVQEGNQAVRDLSARFDDHILEAGARDQRIEDLERDVRRLPCDGCDHRHPTD